MTWMLTASGIEFSLIDPKPEMVNFGDIAEHLSKLARFAGATPGHFYSVAEHCVRAADDLYRRGVALEVCAYVLLHDAHEAYIVDHITPERWAMEEIARRHFDDAGIEAVRQVPKLLRYRIDAAIHAAADLRFPPHIATQELIKSVDLVMLATEKRDLMRPAPTPWPILKGIEPLEERIAPWSWPFAWRRYLESLQRYLPNLRPVDDFIFENHVEDAGQDKSAPFLNDCQGERI